MKPRLGSVFKCGESCGQEGSVSDLLSALLCILAMVAAMTVFLGCVRMVNQKTVIGQIARNYILRMETVGYLATPEEQALLEELQAMGVTEVNLEGTTRTPVPYGAEITLKIAGKIGGEHVFEEKKVSTAKH